MPHVDELLGKVAGLTNPQGFIPITSFTNSWLNYGPAGFDPVSYFKDGSGIVHLRGLLASGVIGSAAFNLPVGFRPSAIELFPVVSNSAFGVCRITAAGDVIPFSGSNVNFALSGITFRAV